MFLLVFIGQELHKHLFPLNKKPEPEVNEAVGLV